MREATYVQAQPTAATPAFSLTGGTYTGSQSLTISDASAGATIYYTTDGTTPTSASSVYSGALTVIGNPVSIQAMASGGNYSRSGVFGASYTTIAVAPTISIPVVAGGNSTVYPDGNYSGTLTSPSATTSTNAGAANQIYYTIAQSSQPGLSTGPLPTSASPSTYNGGPFAISLTGPNPSIFMQALVIGGTGPGAYANSSVTTASYSGYMVSAQLVPIGVSASCKTDVACYLTFTVELSQYPGCGPATLLVTGPGYSGTRTSFQYDTNYNSDNAGTYTATVTVPTTVSCSGGSEAASGNLSSHYQSGGS